MPTEVIFVVVVLAIILVIAQSNSAGREADKRRNEKRDRTSRPISTGEITNATPFEHLGFGMRTQLTRCPKCGRTPGLRPIVSTPPITMPTRDPFASIHDPFASIRDPFTSIQDPVASLNKKRYCSKCKTPLWKVCPRCDGRRVIAVPLEPGEDRYCPYCGAELRQEKQIRCPECGGKGEIPAEHDVASCRSSFS